MPEKNQASARLKLALIVAFCTLPSLGEGFAILWGEHKGYTGKALRDGLDFWAGGFLYLHRQLSVLFDHEAYQSFLQGMYGKSALSSVELPAELRAHRRRVRLALPLGLGAGL